MNDFKREIREFVVENFLFGQDDGFADDTSFLDQGFVDSTRVLELVAHLEQAYHIKVDDAEMIPDNLDSIEAINSFISLKRSACDGIPDDRDGNVPRQQGAPSVREEYDEQKRT